MRQKAYAVFLQRIFWSLSPQFRAKCRILPTLCMYETVQMKPVRSATSEYGRTVDQELCKWLKG
jgi:putative component of membrane protein insertase Oxa1/YidC/SpoIIIJ protein YidD